MRYSVEIDDKARRLTLRGPIPTDALTEGGWLSALSRSVCGPYCVVLAWSDNMLRICPEADADGWLSELRGGR